jgi:uncharacterized protein (DUF433 family)
MQNLFPRITRDPAIMTGKPSIRGMRMTVGNVVSQLAAGLTIDEVLVEFPFLEREDILEALAYAAYRASDAEFELQPKPAHAGA